MGTNANHGGTQPSTSSSVNFYEQARCCIVTKQQDFTYSSCNKFAFKSLTKDLIDAVSRKNFPFYFNSSKVCCFQLSMYYSILFNEFLERKASDMSFTPADDHELRKV